MGFLENLISVSNDILWSYVLIIMLIGLGIYFTLSTKFVQFRMIGEMIRVLGDGLSKDGNKGLTSFQAFCISTASRVGTGNMAGVAIAITLGGPGALFWMWLIALIGSASGFVESTLAQVYKIKDKDGFRGGPAYYMERALNKRWMGILFAVLISICFGLVFNSVQSNTITFAFQESFGVNRLLLGIFIAASTGVIIFGGVKRIAVVVQWLVPIMAGGYILVALFVMITNLSLLPTVIATIVKSAFGLQEVVGGSIGAAVMQGIKRGLFSNEAGMGSVPNAAATAHTSHPVKQGLIQALGVFVDTLLVCSATGFIILLSPVYGTEGLEGINLLQAAVSYHMGAWAGSALAFVVFLFAFSSIIGNYYYGETNIEFIKESKTWMTVYRLAVVGMVLFGSVVELDIVWSMADLIMALMAITNLIAIAMLFKVAKATLNNYIEQRRAGQEPVFYNNSIPGLNNVECWGKKEKSL
jgi:AGCS family alanine or glycine:cation symporter